MLSGSLRISCILCYGLFLESSIVTRTTMMVFFSCHFLPFLLAIETDKSFSVSKDKSRTGGKNEMYKLFISGDYHRIWIESYSSGNRSDSLLQHTFFYCGNSPRTDPSVSLLWNFKDSIGLSCFIVYFRWFFGSILNLRRVRIALHLLIERIDRFKLKHPTSWKFTSRSRCFQEKQVVNWTKKSKFFNWRPTKKLLFIWPTNNRYPFRPPAVPLWCGGGISFRHEKYA